MGLTANSVSDWEFVSLEPDIELREDPDDSSKEQKREGVVYRRRRKAKGNVNFTSEVGDTKTPTQIRSDLSGSDKNKYPTLPPGITKFLCTADTLTSRADGSGIVTEEQEWTAWESGFSAFDPGTELN